MPRIRRAILSCHDKTGLIELAQALAEFDVEIISTAGTLDALRDQGIPCTSMADFIGIEELLGGRVKSLHPRIHAGLLGIRDSKLHQEQMDAHAYPWIDMVVANLHPAAEVLARPGVTLDEVVDQIDIGGSAMIRSAAKNFRYVTVVVNPARYAGLIHDMRAHEGEAPFKTRYRLAIEAFALTSRYDDAIRAYLEGAAPPEE